jgi:hypothetical protein
VINRKLCAPESQPDLVAAQQISPFYSSIVHTHVERISDQKCVCDVITQEECTERHSCRPLSWPVPESVSIRHHWATRVDEAQAWNLLLCLEILEVLRRQQNGGQGEMHHEFVAAMQKRRQSAGRR